MFKIVVEFWLVANPIDVVELAVQAVPMASKTRIFAPTIAHSQPERVSLQLDRNRFSSQLMLNLLSVIEMERKFV